MTRKDLEALGEMLGRVARVAIEQKTAALTARLAQAEDDIRTLRALLDAKMETPR